MIETPQLLALTIYLPAMTALVVGMVPDSSLRLLKLLGLSGSLLTFASALGLVYHFEPAIGDFQFTASLPWIETESYRISHHIGIDGISLFLVALATFLFPLAILSSWASIHSGIKPYLLCLLALETGVIGVFCALDLILFFVFWEVLLIPMYFLIGVWGGQRRIYAAIKFILYTMVGSLLMLLAILYLFFANGASSFDLVEITRNLASGTLILTPRIEYLLFSAFLLAFAIKVPLFPFHTWLPDAHVEAPTAGSVILAGVLLKLGSYGILRFCLPLFPNAAVGAAPYLSIMALVGIIYGALVAMVQPDVKKLVAYSSVSHMGLVILGIFSFNMQGLQGSTLQMINHGLSTGGLFLLVGMIYDRRHTRLISDFGGLAHVSPFLSTCFLIVTLSSIGLPGLNGFVGEVLILFGTFAGNRWYAAVAATGMILSAVYMLWMYQRVFLGKITHEENRDLVDMGAREKLVVIPILVVMLWIGVFSEPFLRRMDASIEQVLGRVRQAQDAAQQPSHSDVAARETSPR